METDCDIPRVFLKAFDARAGIRFLRTQTRSGMLNTTPCSTWADQHVDRTHAKPAVVRHSLSIPLLNGLP